MLFAQLGLMLAFSNASVSAVWPPTGFALAIIMVYGYRMGFGVYIGSLATNIIVFYPEKAELLYAILPASLIGFGNVLEAMVGVYVIRKLCRLANPLSSIKGVATFVIVVTFLAAVISATIGVSTLYLFNFANQDIINELWWTWWLGDTVGALSIAPFVIAISDFRNIEYTRAKGAELLLLVLMGFAIGVIAFGTVFEIKVVEFPFVVLSIPLLIWSSMRFHHFGASLLIIIVSAMAVIGTIRDEGPFARENPADSLLLLQSFVCVMAVCSLLLTAVMSEFKILRQQLLKDNKILERRVAERMAEVEKTQVALSAEIAAKNQVLDAMSKNEFLLTEMGRMAKVGAWEFDLTNQTLFWTEQVFRIHEIETLPSVPEAINCYAEEYRDAIQNAFTHLLQTGEGYDLQLRIKTGTGRYVWVHTNGFARYQAGKMVSVLGIFQDIDEARRMEAERDQFSMAMNQAQKMEAIGTLAGGIAHDFNNILTAIMGYGDLTLRIPELDVGAQRNVQHILDASERARRLVQQILSFSRKGQDVYRPLDLPPIIEEVVELIKATFPSSIAIETHVNGVCGRILAGSTQMHQVLLNLCTNAGFEMRDNGGILRIGLNEQDVTEEMGKILSINVGRYAVLSIQDTGGGISDDNKKRIFEPFFTTKPIGEGTGMGLSAVHGIVASYHGAIALESEVGVGTTFTIYLPITDSDNTGPDSSSTSLAPYKMVETRPVILFVDDEEILLEIGKVVLVDVGYEVLTCNSGEQAWDIFQADPDHIALVMTDQTMPQMSGDELLKRVLNLRPQMRTILMSGYSYTIDEDKARDMGVLAYVQKPYRREHLIEVVQRVLDADNGPI